MLLASLLPTLAAALPLHAITNAEGQVTSLENGVVQVAPGGPLSIRFAKDPAQKSDLPRDQVILECEIFSLGGCQSVSATFGLPAGDGASRPLPDIGHSETWVPYVASLTTATPLPKQWQELTLNLPLAPEASLRIRKVRLRPAVAGEFSLDEDEKVAKRDQLLQDYLTQDRPALVEQVDVSKNEITIRVSTTQEFPNLYLAELPIHRAIDDPARFEAPQALDLAVGETRTLIRPRHRLRAGKSHDGLSSRWQLVTLIDGSYQPVSHARFAGQIATVNPELALKTAKSKKGLGGWTAQRKPHHELAALDIAAVTVNVLLGKLLDSRPGENSIPFVYQGRTYYADSSRLARYDQTFRAAQKQGALVSVVLLVQNPARVKRSAVVRLMGHPDARREGAYAMPAMDSEAGASIYGAALQLLASRYSRPDGQFGRIHHYIVHNEVDIGWVWTNCGVKPANYYFDLYHRSMRLVDTIVREQNAHARAFISLTHHWAETVDERYYPSKEMMERLAQWCHREGDFPWALAYHPYPQSLRNPRVWEDEQATASFETSKITPRNLEVLDAWMRRPEMRDSEGRTRPVHLSENGFNSPDYSEDSLREQAAGMAFAWKKIASLETIKIWHYHNWIDNRSEGGLRIGLRRFPDAKEQPSGAKPIWHLYRDLATPGEDAAIAPYLETIGIKDWSMIETESGGY